MKRRSLSLATSVLLITVITFGTWSWFTSPSGGGEGGLQISPLQLNHPDLSRVDLCAGLERVNSSTRGRFLDAFDTGNEEGEEDMSMNPPSMMKLDRTFSRASAGNSAEIVVTEVQRHNASKHSPMCFYRLRSACLVKGQLVVFHKMAPTTSGSKNPSNVEDGTGNWSTLSAGDDSSFRLCNELRRKINFRFVLQAWPTNLSVGVTIDGKREQVSIPPRHSWRNHAHVLSCWQLYGFHLLECLASAYTAQRYHDVADVDLLIYNHAVSLPKSSSQHYSHATFVGSNLSFDMPVSPLANQLNYAPNPFWGFFAQNTQHAADVVEVRRSAFHYGASRCYNRMLVGQPDPRALRNQDRRDHAQRLHKTLGVEGIRQLSTQSFCATGRAHVTIAQRGLHRAAAGEQNLQGRRGFANLRELVAAAENASVATCLSSSTDPSGCEVTAAARLETNVSVVDWAELSLRQQAAVAARTNILVATHGAGNLWLTFLPPRSVLIEVWPECIGRNVYVSLAKQHNIRYIPICHSAGSRNKFDDLPKKDLAKISGAAVMRRKSANYMTDDVVVNLELLREAASSALRYLVESYACCSKSSSTL